MRSFRGRLTATSGFSRKSVVKLTEPRAVCELVCRTAELDLHRKPGPQLIGLIHSIFDLESAALFDADLNEIYEAGAPLPNLENQIKSVYFFETVRDDRDTGLIHRPLLMGDLPIGSLLLRGETDGATGDAIASLAAITFDRYHSLANETRIERARRTEQLRTTVLDSLAHAYKTPLTAIRAASTGLAETSGLSAAQMSLLSLIDEQTALLNDLTTRLLQTARLESQALELHAEPIALLPLIEEVVAGAREHSPELSVELSAAREDLSVDGDRSVLRAMLSQFVDNAAKYGAAGAKVTIGAKERAGSVVLSVHNFGPVIPPSDQERIFERYFRSSISAGQAPGTGIGLAVAKHAAQAHGGDVWVTSDRERGTTFFASLPIERGRMPDS